MNRNGMLRRSLAAIAVAAGIVSALAGTAAGAAPDPGAHSSVIGGHAASIAEFPSLAFIKGMTEEALGAGLVPFSCTGTVVAPRVVLTAGHCIEEGGEYAGNPVSSYRVSTGVASLRGRTGSNVSSASRVVFYPRFPTARVQVDAGLIFLSTPVVAPMLPLATAADSGLLGAGTPISIAGWGLTGARAKAIPSVLRAGTLVLQSPGYCRRRVPSFPLEPLYSPAAQLCAVDRPKFEVSGCFGDSGGPAIATRADGTAVEVGIIVSGGPECSRRIPNVYTRIDRISAWVAAWIAAVETGAPPPATPTASPPYLSFEAAREEGARLLRLVFHDRFERGVEKQTDCERLEWAKARCEVRWRHGQSRYRGSFTIEKLVMGEEVLTKDRYTIHWAADCHPDGGRASKACAVHSRTGSYP